jgi:hypothetical protein
VLQNIDIGIKIENK